MVRILALTQTRMKRNEGMNLDLLAECREAKRIGIAGHIRPDGDCLGACLGLWQYLVKCLPAAEVWVFLEKPADIFKDIKGFGEIRSDFPEESPFDVFFVLDTSTDRLGGAEKYFKAASKTINIDHQLQRTSQMKYIIEPPKTEAGIRIIPMQKEVCECFKRIIQNRRKPKVEPMVGGNVGFLYLDKNEMPMVALHWEKYFQHIVEKYNKIYKVQMPKVTPHVCRHTYCSHCASSGMNPKHLQYLMGHSDISVTLNTYTHVDFDNVKKEVQSLEKAVL